MMTVTSPPAEGYAADSDVWRPGEMEDERATAHRQAALDAQSEHPDVAMVHAALAIAERISELTAYVSRLA